MEKSFHPSKKHYTGKKKNRLIIEGFHPKDANRFTYAFIASDYLLTKVPLEGKFLMVDTAHGLRPLYVTGTHTWQQDEYVPSRIAFCEYTGKKYRNIVLP